MAVLQQQGAVDAAIFSALNQTSIAHFPERRGDLSPFVAPAPLLGDHSVSDPPDPISNSAVKPDCADGTTA